jgi:hypothetical protein
MKIRELIETLLKVHTLDDEIIVDWISKELLYDSVSENIYSPEEFDNAWLAIQNKGQIEFGESIANTQITPYLLELMNSEIEDMRKEKGK